MPDGIVVVEGVLPLYRKIRLAWRVWTLFFAIRFALLRRRPLPRLVEDLRRTGSTSPYSISPVRLGRMIHKTLSVGRYRPRCLVTSLIFLRMLSEQRDPAVLVIGLPREALNHEAHAWIEVNGTLVGPPPGRAGHTELVRYEPPDH